MFSTVENLRTAGNSPLYGIWTIAIQTGFRIGGNSFEIWSHLNDGHLVITTETDSSTHYYSSPINKCIFINICRYIKDVFRYTLFLMIKLLSFNSRKNIKTCYSQNEIVILLLSIFIAFFGEHFSSKVCR